MTGENRQREPELLIPESSAGGRGAAVVPVAGTGTVSEEDSREGASVAVSDSDAGGSGSNSWFAWLQ